MTPLLPSFNAVARIQRVVAEAYGLDPKLFKMTVRRRSVGWPRQVAMYLAREATGKSFQCIGICFGGLDHSTVHYSVQAVEKRMATVPLYREDVDAIRERLAA